MEKDIQYTGDYANNDGNTTLLSVAKDMLSEFPDQEDSFLHREDSGSHHDKRQFLERMRPKNRMRPVYRSNDKSTSSESSSNKSSSNKSTRNDEREVGNKDDIEFGMFDYTKDDLIHKIADDKQQEEEIVDYYLDNELDTNTKTRVSDKKKSDTIYMRSNLYML